MSLVLMEKSQYLTTDLIKRLYYVQVQLLLDVSKLMQKSFHADISSFAYLIDEYSITKRGLVSSHSDEITSMSSLKSQLQKHLLTVCTDQFVASLSIHNRLRKSVFTIRRICIDIIFQSRNVSLLIKCSAKGHWLRLFGR